MQTARPYQEELDAAIKQAVREGYKSILVCSATGTGKTFVGTRLMLSAEAKGNTSIFLAPRRELVHQTAKRLIKGGVEPGIIMSGEPMNPGRKCQVASFDTLHARAMKRKTIAMPRARIVIPDEAHLSIADTRKDILESFGENSIIVGLTATPARADGKPLAGVYDKLILGWPVARHIGEGYLVDTKYFAPSKPDLSAVKSRRGDYVEKDLEQVMIKPKLVGDVVDNWFALAEGKSTVVFCVTRNHARFVCEEFVRRGVKAEYVDGETKNEERKDIFERVDSGETTVLVNVFVASYGLDIPRLAVCQLARPTKSLVLYFQMVGRVLRPVYADWATDELLEMSAEMRLAAIADSDKPYSIVIDHAGAIDRHGFVDEEVPWTLEGDESVSDVRERERAERAEPKEITCPKCKSVFKGSKFCPRCGFELVAPGENVPTHAAMLEEKVREGNAANKKTPWPEKIAFMGQAKAYAAKKGYASGYAATLYREKFGVWPNDARVRDAAPQPVDSLLTGFIQHKAMKKKFGGNKR